MTELGDSGADGRVEVGSGSNTQVHHHFTVKGVSSGAKTAMNIASSSCALCLELFDILLKLLLAHCVCSDVLRCCAGAHRKHGKLIEHWRTGSMEQCPG